MYPTSGRAWGMGVGGECARAVPVRPPSPLAVVLILTQSLHLKYTCGKHAVPNSSSLYNLFYFVIYNSVSITKVFKLKYFLSRIEETMPLLLIKNVLEEFFCKVLQIYSTCLTFHFETKNLNNLVTPLLKSNRKNFQKRDGYF